MQLAGQCSGRTRRLVRSSCRVRRAGRQPAAWVGRAKEPNGAARRLRFVGGGHGLRLRRLRSLRQSDPPGSSSFLHHARLGAAQVRPGRSMRSRRGSFAACAALATFGIVAPAAAALVRRRFVKVVVRAVALDHHLIDLALDELFDVGQAVFSSPQTSDTASPLLPARPVRRIRCRVVFGGMRQFVVDDVRQIVDVEGRARRRRSPPTRTLPVLKASSASVRCCCLVAMYRIGLDTCLADRPPAGWRRT